MENDFEKLERYHVVMSWIILEYNVCYFFDSDFAGKYEIHPSWWPHRRVNDNLYEHRWELFKYLSNFLGKEISNEVGFDPNRPAAKIVLENMKKKAGNVIEWPIDVEVIFERIITSSKTKS